MLASCGSLVEQQALIGRGSSLGGVGG